MLQVIEIYDGLLKAGADPVHVLSMARGHRKSLLDISQGDEHSEAIEELDIYSEKLYKLVDREEIACL